MYITRLTHRLFQAVAVFCSFAMLATACASVEPAVGVGATDIANVAPSGAYATQVPIAVPSYHGLEPNLLLSYNSMRGNGLLGVGWDLAGLSSIRRVSPGKGAPRYDRSDIFLLDGMELLACTPGMQSPSCQYPAPPYYQAQAYTTRIESFQRIAFAPEAGPGGSWIVWDKQGTIYAYEPNMGSSTYEWHLTRVTDTLGNQVQYQRWGDFTPHGTSYLLSISYNGVVIWFYYEPRPDVISYGVGNDQVEARYRLRTIDITVSGQRARVYELKYDMRSGSGQSFLSEVRQYGRDAQIVSYPEIGGWNWAGLGAVTNAQSIQSLSTATFQAQNEIGDVWGASDVFESSSALPEDGGPLPRVFDRYWMNGPALSRSQWELEKTTQSIEAHLGDYDGDGRIDWLLSVPKLILGEEFFDYTDVELITLLADKGSPKEVRQSLPWIGGPALQSVPKTADINGDGRTDLLFIIYERLLGTSAFSLHLLVAFSQGDGRFAWATSSSQPTHWSSESVLWCETGDISGDGRDDVVCNQTLSDEVDHMYSAISAGDGTFTSVDTLATFTGSRRSHPMAVGDTNGDGLADAMLLDYTPCSPAIPNCTPNAVILSALSKGDGNYQFERQQTSWEWIDPSNGQISLVNADINGDGRSDYVIFRKSHPSAPDGDVLTASSNPDGNYSLSQPQLFPANSAAARPLISMGDADGDGKADLLVASRQDPGVPGCSTGIQYPHVNLHRALSRGNGYFDLPASWLDCRGSKELDARWESIKYTPKEAKAGDVNGDGTADFLLDDATITSLLTAISLREDLSPAPTGDTYDLEPAEFNGDGKTDWVYFRSTTTGPLIMLKLSYNNTYTTIGQSPVPGTVGFTSLRNWKVMDVNGDGRDDLVYVSYVSSTDGIQVNTWLKGDDIMSPFSFTSKKYFAGLPETDRNTPNWRPMDINGDGKTDLVYVSHEGGMFVVRTLISNGDGTWLEKAAWWQSWTSTDLRNWRSADVNGDGKADLVYVTYLKPGVRIHTLLSRGDGTWEGGRSSPSAEWTGEQVGLSLFDTLSWKLMDVNADGATDLVHLSPSDRKPGQAISLRVQTLLSNGDGGWTAQDQPAGGTFTGDMLQWQPAEVNGDHRGDLIHIHVASPAVTVSALSQSSNGTWSLRSETKTTDATRDSNGVFFKLSDVEGSVHSDLTRFDLLPSGMRIFSLKSQYPSDRLTRWTNGLGGTTEITYQPWSTSMPNDLSQPCRLPVGVGFHTVSEIRVSDGRSTIGKETYDYTCAHWSYRERGFLGWEKVGAQRPDSLNRKGSYRETRYVVTDECLAQPSYSGVVDGQGKWLHRTFRQIYPPGSSIPYQCLVSTVNQVETGPSGDSLNIITEYRYDTFGNVILINEYGAKAEQNNDERSTSISYRPAVGPFIVGLPNQVVISEGKGMKPPWQDFRLIYYCYDGDNGTDHSSCPGTITPITKGLLTAKKVVNDNGGYDTTTYGYDSYGNLTSATDANHHGATYFYDPTYHLFPIKACNALSQCTLQEWDPIIGKSTVVTDTNDQRTEFRHDTFGRPTLTIMPDGGTVRHDYLNWGDPQHQRVREQADDGSADGLWTETYLDGLSRPYLTIRKGDAAGKSYTRETIYADATASVYKRSRWITTGSSPSYEMFEYDKLGRPIQQTHPDSSFLSWAYDNNSTRTWVTAYDELNHPRTTISDAYGRLSQVRETDNNTTADTFYRYNAVDELLNITDAAGNVIVNTWDLRGHNRTVNDPDRGYWKYEYDRVGNLKLQIDAKGHGTQFTYDELDRIETKQYPSGREVHWYYDEPGHGASQGRLTSIVDSSEGKCPRSHDSSYLVLDLHYDIRGRLDRQKQCIEGMMYEMAFAYDQFGRLKSITYPDTEVVTYTYDAAGRIESVSGYVTKFEYNAAGQLTSAQLANGVREDFTYDPQREWLKDATATGGSTKLYQAHYEFYANGLHKSSTTNAMNLAYTYDQLNRLTDVSGDIQQHFEYDAIGNITFNSELGTYSYQYTGPRAGVGCGTQLLTIPCPHAVKQIGSAEFVYDDNGNLSMVSNSAPGSIKQLSIEWNRDNEPYIFQDASGVQTNVRYDATGQRVFQSHANDVNLYFGNYLDVSYSATGGPIKTTQYYYAGPLLIARKDATGTYWYHQDHLGSTRSMTDSSGKVVATYDYKPFGDTVNQTGTLANDIQFTGQRADSATGLVYMGARYYDSQIGRFISPDSIIPSLANPQALNRYSYVYNNPMFYVDPSGYQPELPGNEIQTSLAMPDSPQIAQNIIFQGAGHNSAVDTGQMNLQGACSMCHVPRFTPAPCDAKCWRDAAIPSLVAFGPLLAMAAMELAPEVIALIEGASLKTAVRYPSLTKVAPATIVVSKLVPSDVLQDISESGLVGRGATTYVTLPNDTIGLSGIESAIEKLTLDYPTSTFSPIGKAIELQMNVPNLGFKPGSGWDPATGLSMDIGFTYGGAMEFQIPPSSFDTVERWRWLGPGYVGEWQYGSPAWIVPYNSR